MTSEQRRQESEAYWFRSPAARNVLEDFGAVRDDEDETILTGEGQEPEPVALTPETDAADVVRNEPELPPAETPIAEGEDRFGGFFESQEAQQSLQNLLEERGLSRVRNVDPFPQPDRGLGAEAGAGFARGIDQTQAMGFGLLGLMGEVLEVEGLSDLGVEGYIRNMEEAAQNQASVQDPFEEIGGAGDAARYATGVLFEQIPQLALSLLGGGIGGFTARTIANKVVANEIGKRVKAGMAKELAEDQVAELVAARALRGAGTKIVDSATRTGALGGAYVANVGQIAGGSFGEIEQETGLRDPVNALGFALLGGALETGAEALLAAPIANRLVGSGGRLSRGVETQTPGMSLGPRTQTALRLATTPPAEGFTEYVQTGTEQAAVASADPNRTFSEVVLTPEAERERQIAGVAGVVAGGGFSAASEVVSNLIPQTANALRRKTQQPQGDQAPAEIPGDPRTGQPLRVIEGNWSEPKVVGGFDFRRNDEGKIAIFNPDPERFGKLPRFSTPQGEVFSPIDSIENLNLPTKSDKALAQKALGFFDDDEVEATPVARTPVQKPKPRTPATESVLEDGPDMTPAGQAVGSNVRFNGYEGSLAQDGARFLLRADDGTEVEVPAESEVEIVAAPAPTRLTTTSIPAVQTPPVEQPAPMPDLATMGAEEISKAALARPEVSIVDQAAETAETLDRNAVTLLQDARTTLESSIGEIERRELAPEAKSTLTEPLYQKLVQVEDTLSKAPAEATALDAEIQKSKQAIADTKVEQVKVARQTVNRPPDQSRQFVESLQPKDKVTVYLSDEQADDSLSFGATFEARRPNGNVVVVTEPDAEGNQEKLVFTPQQYNRLGMFKQPAPKQSPVDAAVNSVLGPKPTKAKAERVFGTPYQEGQPQEAFFDDGLYANPGKTNKVPGEVRYFDKEGEPGVKEVVNFGKWMKNLFTTVRQMNLGLDVPVPDDQLQNLPEGVQVEPRTMKNGQTANVVTKVVYNGNTYRRGDAAYDFSVNGESTGPGGFDRIYFNSPERLARSERARKGKRTQKEKAGQTGGSVQSKLDSLDEADQFFVGDARARAARFIDRRSDLDPEAKALASDEADASIIEQVAGRDKKGVPPVRDLALFKKFNSRMLDIFESNQENETGADTGRDVQEAARQITEELVASGQTAAQASAAVEPIVKRWQSYGDFSPIKTAMTKVQSAKKSAVRTERNQRAAQADLAAGTTGQARTQQTPAERFNERTSDAAMDGRERRSRLSEEDDDLLKDYLRGEELSETDRQRVEDLLQYLQGNKTYDEINQATEQGPAILPGQPANADDLRGRTAGTRPVVAGGPTESRGRGRNRAGAQRGRNRVGRTDDRQTGTVPAGPAGSGRGPGLGGTLDQRNASTARRAFVGSFIGDRSLVAGLSEAVVEKIYQAVSTTLDALAATKGRRVVAATEANMADLMGRSVEELVAGYQEEFSSYMANRERVDAIRRNAQEAVRSRIFEGPKAALEFMAQDGDRPAFMRMIAKVVLSQGQRFGLNIDDIAMQVGIFRRNFTTQPLRGEEVRARVQEVKGETEGEGVFEVTTPDGVETYAFGGESGRTRKQAGKEARARAFDLVTGQTRTSWAGVLGVDENATSPVGRYSVVLNLDNWHEADDIGLTMLHEIAHVFSKTKFAGLENLNAVEKAAIKGIEAFRVRMLKAVARTNGLEVPAGNNPTTLAQLSRQVDDLSNPNVVGADADRRFAYLVNAEETARGLMESPEFLKLALQLGLGKAKTRGKKTSLSGPVAEAWGDIVDLNSGKKTAETSPLATAFQDAWAATFGALEGTTEGYAKPPIGANPLAQDLAALDQATNFIEDQIVARGLTGTTAEREALLQEFMDQAPRNMEQGAEAVVEEADADVDTLGDPVTMSRAVTPQMDRDYLAAVERGDVETAREMVISAAENIGVNTELVADWKRGGFVAVPVTYLRFGDIPEGVSGRFRGRERIGDEQGVSVYAAWKDPKTGRYLLLDRARETTTGVEDLGDSRPVYEVKGEVLSGESGGDGEPLLRAGTITVRSRPKLSDITTDDLLNIALDGTEWDDALYAGDDITLAPTVRDDDGNVIPLSRRFNEASPDIRESRSVAPSQENIPGSRSRLLAGLANAPYATKLDYHQQVNAALIDPETGNDTIAEMLGMASPSIETTGPSVYSPSPGVVEFNPADILMGFGSVEDATRYMILRGAFTNQNAVAGISPQTDGDKDAARFNLGRLPSEDEVRQIYAAFERPEDTAIFLNGTGFDIVRLGFDDSHGSEVWGATVNRIQDIVGADADPFQTSTIYHENEYDLSTDPADDEYGLQFQTAAARLSLGQTLAGRPSDLQRGAAVRLRERIAGINQAFADQGFGSADAAPSRLLQDLGLDTPTNENLTESRAVYNDTRPIEFIYTQRGLDRGNQARGAESLRGVTESTAGDTRPGESASQAATRRIQEFGRLRAYAEENNLLLPGALFRRFVARAKEIDSGAEHVVSYDDKSLRVIKLTYPDLIGDGTLGAKGSAGDYFTSLLLSREFFGMDTQFEGLVRLDGVVPQVVTSQPYIYPAREATIPEIQAELKLRGFTKKEARKDANIWTHKKLGMDIYDAVPKNVLVDENGVFHWIDVDLIPKRPLNEILAKLDAINNPIAKKLFDVRQDAQEQAEWLRKTAEGRGQRIEDMPDLEQFAAQWRTIRPRPEDDTTESRAVSPKQNADYLAAVERGDMETAQRMVDEAARAAGYSIKAYHGTNQSFNQFDRWGTGIYGSGYYFTTSENAANEYARMSGRGQPRVVEVYLTPDNLGNNSDYDNIASGKSNSSAKTRALIAAGFEGVKINLGRGRTDYLVFSPEQIKSADAITRDDQGNVIPLSQRFNEASPDIRESRARGRVWRPITRRTTAGGTITQGGMFAVDELLDKRAGDLYRTSRMAIKADVAVIDELSRRLERQMKTLYRGETPPLETINTALGNLDNPLTEQQITEIEDLRARGLTNQAAKKRDQYIRDNRRSFKATKQTQALAQLPEELAATIREMSTHIESLSRQLPNEGLVSGDLAITVDEALGTYLNRSYAIFDDPLWVDRVRKDAKVMDAARKYIRNNLTKAKAQDLIADAADEGRTLSRIDAEALANDSVLDDEVENLLEGYLAIGAEAPTIEVLSGRIPGQKNLTMLNQRGNIAPEIQALWGRYEDPKINYAKTVMKLSSVIANDNFLKELRNIGIEEGWLWSRENNPDDTRHPPGYVRISNESNPTLAPLGGMYAHPMLAEGLFKMFPNRSTEEHYWWLRSAMKLTGISMATKTVGSVASQIRNYLGNYLNLVATGNLGLRDIASGDFAKRFQNSTDTILANTFSKYRNMSRAEWRAKIDDYIRRGVVGESITTGLLEDLLTASRRAGSPDFGDIVWSKVSEPFKRVVDVAVRTYSAGDDWFKVMIYEAEQDKYRQAFPDWDDNKIKEKAAVIARDIHWTYSLAPAIVQDLKKFPFIAPFVTFTSEVIRTTYNLQKLARQEIMEGRATGNKELEAIGWKRVRGMATAAFLPAAVGSASMAMAGISGEDEEDLRRFLPDWQKNSQLILFRKDSGEIDFVDVSFLDPYEYFKKPLTSFMRSLRNADSADDILLKGTMDMVRQALDPFTSEQIFAGAIMDVMRNRDAAGRQVYNPQDTGANIGLNVARKIFYEPFVPGTVNSAERIGKAALGIESETGRAYNLFNEIASVTLGQRVSSVDAQQALQFKSSRFMREMRDASALFNREFTSQGTRSTSDVIDGYERSNAARRSLIDAIRRDYLASIRLGVPVQRAKAILRDGGLGGDTIKMVTTGIYKPYNASEQSLDLVRARGKNDRISAYNQARRSAAPREILADR